MNPSAVALFGVIFVSILSVALVFLLLNRRLRKERLNQKINDQLLQARFDFVYNLVVSGQKTNVVVANNMLMICFSQARFLRCIFDADDFLSVTVLTHEGKPFEISFNTKRIMDMTGHPANRNQIHQLHDALNELQRDPYEGLQCAPS